MYEKTECAVIINNNLTEWFRVMIGVRQGFLLSPTLFNIFLKFVMAELKSLRDELHLDEQLLTDCRYGDDTTLIATISEKLKLSAHELEKACSKWGMKINVRKCKVISPETDNVTIKGNDIEKVESFTYLGSVVPGTESDVKRRIALASTAFGNLKENIFSRKDVPKKLEVRLYSSNCNKCWRNMEFERRRQKKINFL